MKLPEVVASFRETSIVRLPGRYHLIVLLMVILMIMVMVSLILFSFGCLAGRFLHMMNITVVIVKVVFGSGFFCCVGWFFLSLKGPKNLVF